MHWDLATCFLKTPVEISEMLKRVSTHNLLIFSALLAGLTILALLLLLHTWEQEQFALKIKTQNELNYKSFQIALESEFQKTPDPDVTTW